MYNLVINALQIPSVEDLAEGKLPYVLLRWPKGVTLPDSIRQGMDERNLPSVPSCNLNLPFTGGAVAKFRELAVAMKGGQRFTIGVDFDPATVRLTGQNKFYISLDPTAVYLNKISEVEPVWTGVAGTPEDDEYAKLLNKAIAAATTKRLESRKTTLSGTPIVEDTAEEVASSDENF
jgi:hypothetical protein